MTDTHHPDFLLDPLCVVCDDWGCEFCPDADETAALQVALYNPRHAIEGWAAGARADGRHAFAERCEAALAIQDGWKKVPA